MTRKQALARHLALGRKVSIKNAYLYFGISNIAREIGRLIEKPLGITLNREMKVSKTKYGSTCHWFEYRATPAQRKKLLRYAGTK